MKQVLCVRTDGDIADSVDIVDVDEPTCDDEHVIVDVRVRPINPADVLLLRGRHYVRPQLPTFVGIEGAGVVVRAGNRSGIDVGTQERTCDELPMAHVLLARSMPLQVTPPSASSNASTMARS